MVEEDGIYRYPGVVVTPESDDEDSHLVKQPVLIIEVLSDTTEKEDRGPKLRQYTQLPSLQNYLIISQDQKLIQLHARREGVWTLAFFDEKDEFVPLPAFDLRLSMAAIYEKVKLT